jgi:hypothetical protein
MAEQEVILMTATAAKDLSDAAISGIDLEIKNAYLRNINNEITKRVQGKQYVLFVPLTDFLYRSDIEQLGYTVEDNIVKEGIPGINISWCTIPAPI